MFGLSLPVAILGLSDGMLTSLGSVSVHVCVLECLSTLRQ